MTTLGINHCGIVVADLDEAIDFYVNVVGLKVLDRRERCGGPISQVLGYDQTHIRVADLASPDGRVIELVHYVSPAAADRPSQERSVVGAGHIAFDVDDIYGAHARLLSGGAIQLNEPAEVAPGKWVCYLQDPFGNWVELIQQR